MKQALLGLLLLGLSGGIAKAESQVYIVAEIKWCHWHPEYATKPVDVCRTEQVVPQGHEIISQMECMRGVSMGSASFWYEGYWWETRGGTCHEEWGDVRDYLASKAK